MASMDFGAFFTEHLKLRHLALVLAVAEYGSLGRAASELYLTQPALSRLLREVETVMGAVLFERTRHGMVPTAAGTVCLEHARAMAGQVDAMRRRFHDLADPYTGSVGIGAHVIGTNLLVPRAVARLTAERPRIEVRIREAPPAELLRALDGGDLDLLAGRITDHPSTAGLKLVPLYRESYRIIAAANHETHVNHIVLADLCHYPWAVPVNGTVLREALEAAFASAGVGFPERHVECGTPASIRTLVAEAGYLALMPESMAAADTGLGMLPLRLEGMAHDVGYMVNPDRPLPAAALLLIDHLQTEATRIEAEIAG